MESIVSQTPESMINLGPNPNYFRGYSQTNKFCFYSVIKANHVNEWSLTPTFHCRIAFEAKWTVTGMTAGKVLTYGSSSATARVQTLINVWMREEFNESQYIFIFYNRFYTQV